MTAVIVPLDVFNLHQNAGWGATFVFGWYANSPLRNWLLPLPSAYEAFTTSITEGGVNLYLLALGDEMPTASLQLWILASLLATLATLYVLVTWVTDEGLDASDQLVGAAYMLAAACFLVSRFLVYDTLLVSDPPMIHHYSVPVGALWMGLVGAIFYFDLFQAELG